MRQKSPQWYEARRGKLTSSFVYQALAKQKSGAYYPNRHNILQRLRREKQGCKIKPYRYRRDAEIWGVEQEKNAILAYENATSSTVTEVGFVPHPFIENLGASPDGIIGEQGVLEVKCPSSKIHQERLAQITQGNYKIPMYHRYQMMLHLMCCERKYCDFVSYDPRFSKDNQLIIIRFDYDAAIADYIEAEMATFNALLNQ